MHVAIPTEDRRNVHMHVIVTCLLIRDVELKLSLYNVNSNIVGIFETLFAM